MGFAPTIQVRKMSAYMSTRHVKPPPPPLFFFSFFLPRLSLVRPRRRLSLAPTAGCCRRRAQGVSRLAAFQRPPSGSAFTRPSTTAGLIGSVDYYPCPVTYPSFAARVIPITNVAFGRSCYEVHGACDVRINLYPAAPIRLAKVLLAWTIVQEGWGSSFRRQIGKRRSAMPTYSHTSNPPDTPDWGGRNSAQCRRYRVRVAPCGTRPCSR